MICRTLSSETRRRGADMAQALLWVSFAILVILGAFYASTLIDLRRAKSETTTMMSALTTELRTIGKVTPDFTWVSEDYLIHAGSVPTAKVREIAGNETILLPFGGTLSFGPAADPGGTFGALIVWDNAGLGPTSLCRYLASVHSGRITTGAMGEEYEVESHTCDSTTPTMSVIYYR